MLNCFYCLNYRFIAQQLHIQKLSNHYMNKFVGLLSISGLAVGLFLMRVCILFGQFLFGLEHKDQNWITEMTYFNVLDGFFFIIFWTCLLAAFLKLLNQTEKSAIFEIFASFLLDISSSRMPDILKSSHSSQPPWRGSFHRWSAPCGWNRAC